MDSLKTTIFRNTAWLSFAKIFNNIIAYILIVAIARFLGDKGLGQYSFIFAFTGLIFLFGDFGLDYLMIRDISRNKNKSKEYFENIFTIKLGLGLILILFSFIIISFLNKELEVIRALWIVTIIQFFTIFSQMFSNFLKSFDRMEFDAIGSMLERLVALFLGLYFLYTNKSLSVFIFALLLSHSVRLLYLTFSIKNKISFKLKFDISVWKTLLIKAFPFFLTGVFVTVYFRIDTIMLSLIKGDAVTGWYNSAYKLVSVLTLIPNILIVAILPSMSRLFKQNKSLLKILFHRVFRYLTMLVFPISVGTVILADRFIEFIYGKTFIGGSLSLQILIFAELFIFVNYLMGHLLNSIDKQKYFTTITGICAVFNVVLNIFLIPKFSYVGAGVATVLTELLNFILLRIYVGKFLTKIRLTSPMIKSFFASLVMGVVVYYLSYLAVWYIVPIGAVVYFLTLILFKLEKEDKLLLSQGLIFVKNRLLRKI